MMSDSQEWITLRPKLGDADEALQVLIDTVNDLAAEHEPGPIRQIRKDKLKIPHAKLLIEDLKVEYKKAWQVARICITVFCDLRAQGWNFRIVDGQIQACKPTTNSNSTAEEKHRIREGLLLERDQQLSTPAVREFVERMERQRLSPQRKWVSIYSLMRDGRDLAIRLEQASNYPVGQQREVALRQVISPYIQVVDDTTCEHTGLALKDIWRYFRYTWANSPKTVPGRNLWFLVRDAAAPYHPVIGIAALSSAIVQLTERDMWIGWHGDTFLKELAKAPTDAWATWLDRALTEQVAGIYVTDFLDEGILTSADLVSASPEAVQKLLKSGGEAKEGHNQYPHPEEHKEHIDDNEGWEKQALTQLFRAKRAKTLASLLEAKARLRRAGFLQPTSECLAMALQDREGRAAIKEILRRVKATHVGIDMMDITVCGAIQPYNALLGGKLVSLLMASPEVAIAYQSRYATAASVIASSMAGRAVRRPPKLVLLSTTSLYSVGASQYNRIQMPAAEAGGKADQEIRYHKVGHTMGFGSFHFSPETLAEIEQYWAQGHDARTVNSIFGEGVNPRLRKIRDGLDAAGLASERILLHGDRRIVYAIPLARNFRQILLGMDDAPDPILPHTNPEGVTQQMADFWLRRWLAGRIKNEDVLAQVARHTLSYPIDHGARVVMPPIYIYEESETGLPLFGYANGTDY